MLRYGVVTVGPDPDLLHGWRIFAERGEELGAHVDSFLEPDTVQGGAVAKNP